MRKFTHRKKSEGVQMALSMNPALNQQMAQLEQEYMQRRNELMQSFYNQQNNNNWNQQNTQAQQTVPAQNVNWIQVSGIDGAKNQIVQQGHTAWMMDNNNPYFYVKSVDKIGSPEFHAFFFQEISESEINQRTMPADQPQIDLSQYVQRGEFEQLKTLIEQFTNEQEKQPVKENKEVVSNGESVNGNDGKQTGTGRTSGTRGK